MKKINKIKSIILKIRYGMGLLLLIILPELSYGSKSDLSDYFQVKKPVKIEMATDEMGNEDIILKLGLKKKKHRKKKARSNALSESFTKKESKNVSKRKKVMKKSTSVLMQGDQDNRFASLSQKSLIPYNSTNSTRNIQRNHHFEKDSSSEDKELDSFELFNLSSESDSPKVTRSFAIHPIENKEESPHKVSYPEEALLFEDVILENSNKGQSVSQNALMLDSNEEKQLLKATPKLKKQHSNLRKRFKRQDRVFINSQYFPRKNSNAKKIGRDSMGRASFRESKIIKIDPEDIVTQAINLEQCRKTPLKDSLSNSKDSESSNQLMEEMLSQIERKLTNPDLRPVLKRSLSSTFEFENKIYNDKIKMLDNDFQSRTRMGLSLSGGGIRGLLQVLYLMKLEELAIEDFGKKTRISDLFDDLAGTSIGGIITLALSIDIRPGTLYKLFETERQKIFPKGNYFFTKFIVNTVNTVKSFMGRKYNNKGLTELLEKYFGDSTFEDVKVDTKITACKLGDNKNDIKGVILSNRNEEHRKLKLARVGLYTSAAPTFFEAVDGYIDGGLYKNNPCYIQALELMNKFNIPPKEVKIFSIGTGKYMKDQLPRNAGLINGGVIIDKMFSLQESSEENYTRDLLKDNFYHLNPVLSEKIYLDNTSKKAFNSMINVVKQSEKDVVKYWTENSMDFNKKLEQGGQNEFWN